MGRGDKKTKRGKIFKGSFGKSRMRVSKVKKVLSLEKKAQAFFFYADLLS